MGAIGVGQRCPAKQLHASLVDFTVCRFPYRVPRDKDTVPSGFNLGHARTHRFPHTTLHKVSHDRTSDSPADRETESAVRKPVSQDTQHRQAIAETPAPTPNFHKSLIVANPELSSQYRLRPSLSIENSYLRALGRKRPPDVEPSLQSLQQTPSCPRSRLR